MYLYSVYGRYVGSNIEMPGFLQVEDGHCDIEIVWPESPAYYPGLDSAEAVYNSHYHPTEGGSKPFALFKIDGAYVLRWEELCDFEVPTDGSRIVCHPWPGVPWGEVNPFIQGRVIPLALNFQRAVTLHGAVVAVDGGAVALLGTSGTGKSTLSATFHALGHSLIADDLVAVWQDKDRPMVQLGPNHVRLDERSMEYMESRSDAPLQAFPDYDKTRVVLRSGDAGLAAGIPLRTIYLLERVGPDELKGPEIVALPLVESLPTLMQNISNKTILDKKRLGEQFELVTSMINKVPVRRLRYPSGMERLPEVCKAVDADRE